MAQAELAVLDALRSAKGRGKEGLSEEVQQQLGLAVSVLEADGGVSGACAERDARRGRTPHGGRRRLGLVGCPRMP